MIPPLLEKHPIIIENKPQKSWQAHMRDAINDVQELWQILDLPLSEIESAHQAQELFPLKVPRGFVARMKKGDLSDPLLSQILPLGIETDLDKLPDPNFITDPVADLNSNPIPGIIHKYFGRVLLICTGACAVHCRYCFRRHFPYNEQVAARQNWHAALSYIEADTTIHEVILSGGDPLSLSDAKLSELFNALNTIPHVKTIRIHTRQPIVLPQRIDEAFISIIKKVNKNVVMVLHANHANELDESVAKCCQNLKNNNIHLLNQSVLLKGVNDDSICLIKLSHKLFELGVFPYYLNLLDKVSGAEHFEISETKAITLHKEMKAALPGYLVPNLVRDIPDRVAKTWITEN